MASAEVLQKQIEELTKKLKESEDVKKKYTVYTKEKRFSTLSHNIDVDDWFDSVDTYVRSRFDNDRDMISFIVDHIERNAKTELKFNIDIDKSTTDDVLRVLKELYCDKDTVISLQKQFYTCNQGDESIENYAFNLMNIVTKMVVKYPAMNSDREVMMKEKFADGVSNIHLKRELKRLNEERSSMKFSELRTHAKDFIEEIVVEGSKSDSTKTAASESVGMRYKDMCDMLKKQQEQITDLAKLMKGMNIDRRAPVGMNTYDRRAPVGMNTYDRRAPVGMNTYGSAPVGMNTNKSAPVGSVPKDSSVSSYDDKLGSLTCYYCRKQGHVKSNCFKLQRRMEYLNEQSPAERK